MRPLTDYRAGKGAPESFENISIDVLSLHAVLKEGEETLFIRPLSPVRAERLKVIKDGCDKVLVDLQNLVKKYESLGTQSKRTWDRMKWGNEDIAEIRARLTSNISNLNAFISMSQVNVETKLDKFIQEFRQGKKETSIISLQTVDSISADDKVVWRTIRKELEEIGITVAAFEANRTFIFDWFARAVKTGAFDEENEHAISDESDSDSNNEDEPQSNEELGIHEVELPMEHRIIEPLKSDSEDQPPARQTSSQSARVQEPGISKRGLKKRDPMTFDQMLATSRSTPGSRPRVPRVALLLAGLSRPRERLIRRVATRDYSKALKILKDEASFQLLDLETLDDALWRATHEGRIVGDDHYSLIAKLIARGANVNYISSDSNRRTPLWNSVEKGWLNVVQLLIENGADVNYTGSDRSRMYEPGRGPATDFAPRAAVHQSPSVQRLLLSSGVNVNIQYMCPILGSTGPQDCIMNLIHEVTFYGDYLTIEALLKYGASIDAISPNFGTALMLALLVAKKDVIRFLLYEGANPNFKAAPGVIYGTLPGQTYASPLEAAINGGRSSSIKLLLDRGVVPDKQCLRFARNAAARLQGGLRDTQRQEIVRLLEKATATGKG